MNLRNLGVSLLFLGLVGCGTTPATKTSEAGPDSKPKVVVSYSVLCDLTKQIAQETVDLKCLLPAGQDPHTYQPTPDDRKAIDTGDLVLYGGYDFEPSVIKLVQAAGKPETKVAVNELAVPKPIMGEHEHGEHDHGEKNKAEAKTDEKLDSKPEASPAADKKAEAEKEADPHVWHNAQNGIAIVQVIQDKLTKLSPKNADLYAKNATALRDRLTKIDGWIKQSIATIPAESRKLVTTHDALTYYGAAYAIPIEGALQGLSTEEKPTATRIKALVDEIKASKVPMIFAEVTTNPKLIETVAKESSVKLSSKSLFADGLGEQGSGAETYEQMLVANTNAIVEGLGGKLTPAP
jgi:manganese/iron transport system substrate-binding protein